MFSAANRLKDVHSDIRGPLYEEALKMQRAGTPVLRLNTGNPAAFGFGMPQSIREALLDGMDKAVGYCDLRGMQPAREAILKYHRSRGVEGIDMDRIFIGNGVSELVSLALTATLNPGDEVLTPMPCYTLWSNSIRLEHAKPVFYRCDEAANWYPDVNDMRAKITPRTRAVVLIQPNNPTGAVYPKEVLEQVLTLAREHHLLVFSDEIYDRLVMDGKPQTATASLAPDLPIITMNGLSKSHCVCGFRCGWMVVSGPEKEVGGILYGLTQLAAMRLCANALMQLVIPAALHDEQSTNDMILPGGRLYEQRRAATEVLDQIEGLSYVKNSAAFYLFPKLDTKLFGIRDDHEFAHDLLVEKHILVVPGSGFEMNTNDHFRLVMLPEPDKLHDALLSLKDFLDERRTSVRRAV